jgi:hypothetical protein
MSRKLRIEYPGAMYQVMNHLVALWLLLLPVYSLRGQTNDLIVSEVSVLTIHVSDTNTHDAVFHFLTDVLKLPVDYYPVMAGQRRYAAVYAGNMFIEPCGPYSNMRYPVKEFKALFYGLNCTSDASPPSIATNLGGLHIAYEPADSGTFRIQGASVSEGVYLAVSSKAQSKPNKEREASLRSALAANNRDSLGFEYVKEIWLGYAGLADLQAWREFLGASGRVNDTLWRLSQNQSIRFVRSEVRGVRGIVCKVRSMEQAERYLKETKTYGRTADGRIELDAGKTCGLLIYLAGQ